MNIISGKIEKGRGMGRKLGFPTLNIAYNGELSGVFAGKVFLNGEWIVAAIHIGSKPTFNDEIKTCEAFLIDWNGDVEAGTPIKIEISKKIRDTKKFDDKESLIKQISEDVEFIKNWYNSSDD